MKAIVVGMGVQGKKRKKLMYKNIYKMVEQKINYATSNGLKDCYYIFPEYIPGYPIINRVECLCFIIQRIRKYGHKCIYVHPMTLYIKFKKLSS